MVHRIGIIGLGIMGQRMLGNRQSHAGFTVAAAWDAAPQAMDWLRRTHPGSVPAAAAADLAAATDLAAIYIASSPVSHSGYVNLAWDHGKVVFCEKALAVGIAASQALVRRCEAEQRRAAVNFSLASAPAVQQMMEALASGALGALQSIDIDVAFASWPRRWQKAGDWLAHREEGGLVREVVSHSPCRASPKVSPCRSASRDCCRDADRRRHAPASSSWRRFAMSGGSPSWRHIGPKRKIPSSRNPALM